ncbi:MAG: methylaspartate ammonia-lyase, partial [Clostridiales bacterium]|nr:methylaspartate ammonia-lyase [Clostridiales bacterium]
MKIIDVLCTKGLTGFFFDDQRAIKNGALVDVAAYLGKPVTDGFCSIRQAGESVGIMLFLDNGAIAYGDCAAVQYSGAGGRYPLFLADKYISIMKEHVFPLLINREIGNFRDMSEEIDRFINPTTGKRLHTAIRYGVSQAVLHAVAIKNHEMMTDVVAREYGTTVIKNEIPIFTQSGDSRYTNVDKMILKKAGSLPHGLINSVPDKLGYKGEKLLEYVTWLATRIGEIGSDGYKPILHIDVYGTIGQIFDNDYERIYEYLKELEDIAHPFLLRIEGPTDAGNRMDTMIALKTITALINNNGSKVEIVADEWCNTLEDIKLFADKKA